MDWVAERGGRIRFALSKLRSQNGAHEFERICFELARVAVTANVTMPTGPVGAGGDGGADFRTFPSAFDRLGPLAVRSGIGPDDDVRFSCTLQQRRLPGKLRSDIRRMIDVSGAPDWVIACFEADLNQNDRIAVQGVAEELGVKVIAFDGAQITDLLNTPDPAMAILVERFLHIGPLTPSPESQAIQDLSSGIAVLSRGPRHAGPRLVGRTTEIASLGADTDGTLRRSALEGEGGIGKSALARWRFSDCGAAGWRVTWWVDASTDPALPIDRRREECAIRIEESLAHLARAAGIAADEEKNPVAAELAAHWLGSLKDPWLLVIDDAVDAGALLRPGPFNTSALLPATGCGHIVSTTQRPHGWREQGFEVVHLQPLDHNAATDMLVSMSGAGSGTRATAERLAEALAYHPLAMAQAGALLTDPLTTFESLETELASAGVSHLLDRSAPADHASTVWELQRRARSRVPEDARMLLSKLGWLRSASVSLDLVGQVARALPPDRVHHCVRELADAQLITVDAAAGTLSMHALTTAITREATEDPDAVQSAVIERLAPLLPWDVYQRPEDWPQIAELVDHATVSTAACRPTGAAGDLLNTLGNLRRDQGRLPESEDLLARAVEIRSAVYSPNSLQAAASLGNLGVVQRHRAKWSESESSMRMALAIEERHLAPRDPGLAVTLGNLGCTLRESGRPTEGETALRRALEIEGLQSPRRDRETARVLNNLGRAVADQGRWDEALKLLDEGVLIESNAEVQSSTLLQNLYTNIGHIRLRSGDPKGALDSHQTAFRQALSRFGPTSHRTAMARINVGETLGKLGRTSEALAELNRAEAVLRTELGNDHLEVAIARHNTAEVRLDSRAPDTEMLETALEEARFAGRVFSARYGPDHEHTRSAADLERRAIALLEIGHR
jgi:tetratricopeptide (TPR) repeat protein